MLASTASVSVHQALSTRPIAHQPDAPTTVRDMALALMVCVNVWSDTWGLTASSLTVDIATLRADFVFKEFATARRDIRDTTAPRVRAQMIALEMDCA